MKLTDILVSLDSIYTSIAAIMASILAMYGHYLKSKKKLDKLHDEIKEKDQKHEDLKEEFDLQREALTYSLFPPGSQEVISDLSALFEDTQLDRFLLLKGWNGYQDMKFTNSVFQYRLGRQEVISYEAWKTDDHYNMFLKTAEKDGKCVLVVDQMPHCRLKDAYRMEGVKHSVIFFISRTPNRENPHRYLISYCSFATHEDSPIEHDVLYRCEMILGKIRLHENYSFA